MKHVLSIVALLLLSLSAKADAWMSRIDDNVYINQLSIPGSHDSGTGHGWTGFLGVMGGNLSALTQGKNITAQWASGVRVFDLRPGYTGSSLEIFHGVCQTNLSMRDALAYIVESLAANPSEFAIVLTRHESDGDSNNASWGGAMANLLNQEPFASYIIPFKANATLKEVRGKMMVLTRDDINSPKASRIHGWRHSYIYEDFFGGYVTLNDGTDAGNLAVQDFYDNTGDGGIQNKIGAMLGMNRYAATLNKAAEGDEDAYVNTLVINHCSGYTASASSNGNRDTAAKANTALLNQLRQGQDGPTGIVMMDFVGDNNSNGYQTNSQALTDEIINLNFRNPLLKSDPEFYAITANKASTTMDHTERIASKINLKVGAATQSIDLAQVDNRLLYQDFTDQAFFVRAGTTVTPSITWKGSWMHAYCYVDWNRDGRFKLKMKDGKIDPSSEIVAYNYFNGTDSKGAAKEENLDKNCGVLPSFTVPAGTQPGMYRIRFKIDWNNVSPKGSYEMPDCGGLVADAMLCVYGDKVEVTAAPVVHGKLSAANGRELNALQVSADAKFGIKAVPDEGYTNGGVSVKCGYNLTGGQRDHLGNSNYITYEIPDSLFAADNTYTIPAKQMRANLLLRARMPEKGHNDPEQAGAYTLNFPTDLQITRTDRRLNSFSLITHAGETEVSLEDNTYNCVYVNKRNVEVVMKPGETVTPYVDYTGRAMHTYWYVDLNEDGAFSNALNADGTPAGELLSYSCYNGKNSLGQAQDPIINPSVNQPLTIPASTKPGLYRARFKIDWNNIDPAGQYGGDNQINDNGGYIVDFMIHVVGTTCPISTNANPTTGNLLTSGSVEIAAGGYPAARNQKISIRSVTTNGTPVLKIVARSGYHFGWNNGSRFGNRYWTETELTQSNGLFVIPAEMLDRPVKLTVTFGTSSGIEEVTLDAATEIYNLQGQRVANPTRGIYIINGKKIRL